MNLLPQFLDNFGALKFHKKVSGRRIIIYEAIFNYVLYLNTFILVVMSEVLHFFSPKWRYARAFPQELHILTQFLCDFDELNLYKKVSGRHIIIYEVVFKLGFISTCILFSSYELVLYILFHQGTPGLRHKNFISPLNYWVISMNGICIRS